MDLTFWIAATGLGVSLAAHAGSTALAAWRLQRDSTLSDPIAQWPAVTLIRPVCGIDQVERETLASTFRLKPASLEILFCAAREKDPAVAYVRHLMAQHPEHNARVLVGVDGPGINPKLDNVRKGWRAARHEWVLIADSNVSMSGGFVLNMLRGWQRDTGLVCAPPIATDGRGLWAAVEAQFMNSYQARWQYAADAVGLGYAQGKSMLFNKCLLDSWGGIDLLDLEAAEDAAATKVVRDHGYRVRLAPETISQPIGRRSLTQVWARQCRWAQLRRLSFSGLFCAEPFSMLWFPLVCAGVVATASDTAMTAWMLGVAGIWLAIEAIVAFTAGWRVTVATPWAALCREAMAPLVWLSGWRSTPFKWREPAPQQRTKLA